ncbi:MAG: exodeoxyribonuclease V subunit beta [Desulfobacterales bacterium]|nr:exodeoxyribonuclease V subunit beta [Desulfobacterales bacterium]
MGIVKPFDIAGSALEGVRLIEASAGTGKTYTISGLFLRLITEKRFTMGEILVVTFTEAATQELKDRIYQTLRKALHAFSCGRAEDELLEALLEQYRGQDPGYAVRAVKEALRDFDKNAIVTIHGFCNKMLYDHAFESGSLFDTRLITEQGDIKKEIVEDFWRSHFYRATPLFVSYCLNVAAPGRLFSLVQNQLPGEYLKIIPRVQIPDAGPAEAGFMETFRQVSGSWPSVREEIRDIFLLANSLSLVKYRPENIPAYLAQMDDYVASGGLRPRVPANVIKFAAGEIAKAVKKGRTAPRHFFFDLFEKLLVRRQELDQIYERTLLGLKVKLFDTLGQQLKERKRSKNIQSFDDLLLDLHGALYKAGGDLLAGRIRQKFKAALIDEFQDTDPVQYAIFKKVFDHPDRALFLIGDPKQAIYGFRGADIFAYMDAARHTAARYTLKENWRSEPGLVQALNLFFGNRDQTFVYHEIPFTKVSAARKKDPVFLQVNGMSAPPLQVWVLETGQGDGSGRAMTRRMARQKIPGAVAGEISCLTDPGGQERALLGVEPLQESDIAVLVLKNRDGRLMQEALAEWNIPSVRYGTENIFDSREAYEIQGLLAAVAQPGSDSLIRTALATDMLGMNATALYDLKSDDARWEEWIIKFRQYHHLWNTRGFIRMFKQLIREESILPRLMGLDNGERRCTNLLHLVEVLHHAAISGNEGMAGLVKWLCRQRDVKSTRLDEYQLRLESDEKAVKIVTIHKSKGLEYPVVFCPFMWDDFRPAGPAGPVRFHDEADNLRLTLDLGSENIDQHRQAAQKEMLAENLRLLYVALTRAKNRCYLVFSPINNGDTSALAYLFNGSQDKTNFSQTNAPADPMLDGLYQLRERAGETIRVSEIPERRPVRAALPPAGGAVLEGRQFSGRVHGQWQISSFTSLQSGGVDSGMDPAFPGLGPADPEIAGGSDEAVGQSGDDPGGAGDFAGIFSFPRGPKPGIFLHDLLANLDFVRQDRGAVDVLIREKLDAYGFDGAWQETIRDLIDNVLSAPLATERTGFSLSKIDSRHRVNEMEFYFPLKRISPETFGRIFRDFGAGEPSRDFPTRMERLAFNPVHGFMRGFMDLVFQFEGRFYLADYKSNYLGPHIRHYHRRALVEVMNESGYILQYHIYLVALHQYLKLRVPGYSYATHFGGVYYLFLRGMDPEKGADYGIFMDRPREQLVNELWSRLIQQP